MQSFLQYRRAGLAARAQIERDLEKAQLVTGCRSKTEPKPLEDGHKVAIQDSSAGPKPASEETDQEKRTTGHRTSDTDPATESHELGSPLSSASSSDSETPRADSLAVQDLHTVPTAATQYTVGTALGQSLTGIHVRDRRTHEGKGQQVFVVDWEGSDDPLCPKNWSTLRRVGVTLQISVIAAAIGVASGIDATVIPQAAADLGVSEVAETLATGLYLVGMGVGSLIAGPFSETFGRNAVYIGSLAVFAIWIMASGLAPNFGSQIVFRFLAGCAASTPLVCSGGSVSDMYNSLEKTWAFPLYAISAFGGPMLGAVMGAYIGPSPLVSWRWAEWTTLILSGVVVVVVLLFMPETFAPLLLQWKAAHYRRITGDERFRAEHEIVDATLLSRLKVSMTRPFLMLTEPIILFFTMYLTVVYIVLFTFLIGWPYIYETTYGLDQGLTNVIFIAMFVGVTSAFVLIPVVWHMTVKQVRSAEARGRGTQFNPEIRLWYAMLGPSFFIPVSLFWMGWTDFSHISIWSPIFAAALFGFGVMGVFICAYMYVIDSYEIYSASALTFVALVRYVAAGGMTVVGIPFYENMGTQYTLTILACISALLTPIPYVLYKWGHLIRAKSKYAVSREI